jgi:uncharacterized MAPEG superfamily protein
MSKSLLRKLGACKEGLEWARGKSWRKQWETCEYPEWMLWALGKLGYSNHPVLGRYACDCARYTPIGDGKTVWDCMTDASSRNAVTVAENYLDGQATIEELEIARCCVERTEKEAYSRYLACRVPSAFVSHFAALTAASAATFVVYIAERSNDVSRVANVAYFAERVAYHAASAADPNVNAAHIATEEWQSDHLRELIPWAEVRELIANYNECQHTAVSIAASK